MRRVVVTGLGLVTPLGNGVKTNWDRLLASQSGIRRIEHFQVSDLPAQIAGVIPRGTGEGELDLDAVASPKDRRRMDDFIVYGLAAAMEAVEDSGWKPQDDEGQERTGVMIGSGIGGLPNIVHQPTAVRELVRPETRAQHRDAPLEIERAFLGVEWL